ncbi:MAG TPA: hypothetical protein VK995_04915 [Oceanipulchritudo sp.]|nr:hypothetical protein [Oceanipulchritudo sp.]
MKSPYTFRHVLLGMGLLASSPLFPQSATFTFIDPSFGDPSEPFGIIGDVVEGQVTIDLSTGQYTIIWVASEYMDFYNPAEYVLNLYNTRTSELVTLSHLDESDLVKSSMSFSGGVTLLSTWENNDLIVTAGTTSTGVNFTSGIFSTDPFFNWLGGDFDKVDYGGLLVVEGVDREPAPLPPSEPEPDSDGDGIPDTIDPFDFSDLSPTVALLGIDTGIPNGTTDEPGATLADIIADLEQEAAANARNNGQYTQQLVKDFKLLEEDGWLTAKQRAQLIRIIARN